MLYDQALLARVYLHAWQLTGEPRHRQVLDETIEYVLRDLRHPLGGFFSAEDADSEGVEGRFYVWSYDGVRIIAGPDAEAAIEWYGITEEGNWEDTNILERVVRGDLERPDTVERARAALFEARDHRVRPGLDSKVLLEWNGLMLATLAEAAAATGDRRWLDAALETASFLCNNLRDADGRWLRTWQGPVEGTAADGHAKILAYGADHGAMIDAFIRLGEASGEARWIDEAITTADALIELFWDEQDGGVFSTGSDAESLVTRPKELMDNATPGANSLAAVGLLRLAAITGGGRSAPARLRPSPVRGRTPEPRIHRDRHHRRSSRPRLRRAAALESRCGAGLGRTDLLAAVGGSGRDRSRRPGLRVPRPRVRAPRR